MYNLFYNIQGKNKEKLLNYLEANTFTFKKKTSILEHTKKDNIICVVLEGSLELSRIDYNGNRTLIEEFTDNSVFGSTISAINNNEYKLITKEDTKLIILDLDNVLNFDENRLSYYTQFLKNLTKILFEKVKENNERIELLTNMTIRNKLLAYFKLMSKKNGSIIIYLPFNYTDLADYLAINRSAMTRELKNMKNEKLIETKGKRIKLLYYV